MIEFNVLIQINFEPLYRSSIIYITCSSIERISFFLLRYDYSNPMDMPPVHMCVFLTYEHQQLKTKIIQLKSQIAHLKQTISEKNLDQSRSCSISCQTDLHPRPRSHSPVRFSFDDQTHLHRLINEQNDLLKKYEAQALEKRHQRQSPPSAMIDDYEHRLTRCQREKEHAEQRAIVAQKRLRKFEERFETMRRKMNLFDDGFFDEVNDLKFALQQANRLSEEYEKTIQMLSAQLGITYP